MVSPDGAASSQMVHVSAAVNLPLHHKVQEFSSGTGSPRWSRKKGCKMVVVVRQITMSACQHLIFCRPDALLDAQPTVSMGNVSECLF